MTVKKSSLSLVTVNVDYINSITQISITVTCFIAVQKR